MKSTKFALITGGARGLGRAICLELAELGFDIAFTYLQNHSEAEETKQRIQLLGKTAICHSIDSGDYHACEAFLDTLIQEKYCPDTLINNAGMNIGAAIHDLQIDEWNSVVHNNLNGYFHWIRLLAPHLMKLNKGCIVNVSSINAARGRVGGAAYNTAKAGIEGLTRTAANELGTYGIRVNAVAPGFIYTDSQRRTPELIKKIVWNETALKRFAQPEDISGVIGFLCTEKAGFITGQTLCVDGGQSL